MKSMVMNDVGLRLPNPREVSRETSIEFARLADTNGISSIWIGESWHRNSVPLLTDVIHATQSTNVCSGIFNIFSRTPGLIAMTAASLADASDNRFQLGLGTSGPRVIEQFHGQSFDAPLRRTREYVEIIREFLNGTEVNYNGELFTIEGFSLPIDEPYSVPIYLAAMGKKNLELTGGFADGWIPLLVPIDGIETGMQDIARGADKFDRTVDDITVAPWIPTCISTENPEEARSYVRSLLGFYIGAMGDYYANAVSRFGYEAEANAIQNAWDSGGSEKASSAVTDEMLAAFTAAGTPDEANTALAEYREAGADMPIAYIPSYWAPEETIRETINNL